MLATSGAKRATGTLAFCFCQDTGVLAGVLTGVLAGVLAGAYSRVTLPDGLLEPEGEGLHPLCVNQQPRSRSR